MSASGDPWQQPVRGGHPDPALLALPGAEQLEHLISGQIPQPPISRLTGLRLVELGEGTSAFEWPLTEWLQTSQGAISLGPMVIPADAAMACAIQTVLPPRTPFATSELSLRLIAPARPGARLMARGRLIRARSNIALAEASLLDQNGELIAHGSSMCLMQPELAPSLLPDSALEMDPAVANEGSDEDAPDPWKREARGTVLEQAVWESYSGSEILRAQLAGDLPPPPVHHLTGLELTGVGNGSAEFALPASAWLCAPPRGRVQGGAVALLAEAALSAAIQTEVAAATALAPIDLKVNYLRPLSADGRPATAKGSVVHAGRRVAVANSEVTDADGRRIAIATGSAMLLPGRPATLGAVEA
jgi:uncharacterized protein (TIGR00369 family)